MLHTKAIEPRTLELLKTLMGAKSLKNYYLAGGTALAMLTGHRQSIDLDLFTRKPLNIEELRRTISSWGEVGEQSFSENVIYQVFVNGIKVDFVSYGYELLEPIQALKGLRLAGMRDIAAMKIGAIAGRGSKKDFFDLVELLNHYGLTEILEFYKSKYPSANVFHAIKSLTYFEDAENEPEPVVLHDLSWQKVKNIVSEEARKISLRRQ